MQLHLKFLYPAPQDLQVRSSCLLLVLHLSYCTPIPITFLLNGFEPALHVHKLKNKDQCQQGEDDDDSNLSKWQLFLIFILECASICCLSLVSKYVGFVDLADLEALLILHQLIYNSRMFIFHEAMDQSFIMFGCKIWCYATLQSEL